jgi:hypothetical protein
MGGGGAPGAKPAPGVVGLVNRRTGERPGDSPDLTTPETSGDGSVSQGQPGSLAYKNQEADSASSLGSLINEVADFVVPERVPEKIPHKATGACPRNDASSRRPIFSPSREFDTAARTGFATRARGGEPQESRARARLRHIDTPPPDVSTPRLTERPRPSPSRVIDARRSPQLDDDALNIRTTKTTGFLFWAFTMVLWHRIMGRLFIPFGVYFAGLVSPAFNPIAKGDRHHQHAAQVGIVVMIYAFLLSCVLVYPNYFLFFAHPYARAAFIAYCSWVALIDTKAPSNGTRFLPWTRRLPFWNTLADYFPVRLHKTCDLDPSGNYLFGYHPHGIIGVGALITFATSATGFDQAFPGLDLRLLTLAINFYFPFTREVLMALGINSVTKESVVTNLTRKPGASVAIVVGGAAEALDARPGWAVLTLARRKGFVKMALKTGASLVPVFAFGENDIFDQVDNPDGGALRRFQLWCKQLIGITPPLLYGRNLSRGVFRRFTGAKTGVLPKRESIEVVVGAPIACPKTSDPTSAQIDEYHARYVAALRDLYETHRRLFHKLKRHGSHDDLVKRMRQMKSMRLN